MPPSLGRFGDARLVLRDGKDLRRQVSFSLEAAEARPQSRAPGAERPKRAGGPADPAPGATLPPLPAPRLLVRSAKRHASCPAFRGDGAPQPPSPGAEPEGAGGVGLPRLLGRPRERPAAPRAAACGYPAPGGELRSYCAHRRLVPKFFRAASGALRGDELDLSDSGAGDAQLAALLADVPAEAIRHWRLRDARLSGAGLEALAAALPACAETLDLSRNAVGPAVGALARLAAEGGLAGLRRLDLSSCGLRSEALGQLLAELGRCRALFALELNDNQLSGASAATGLGSFVAHHRQVMQLSLHGNCLSGAGCAQLFKGVIRNGRRGGQVASVDIAWNGAGRVGGEAAARAIAAVLRESATLYHLDLSYNGLDAACCAAIAEGLLNNHHLFGLHMVGNAATMDADGFLLPLDRVVFPHDLRPGQAAVQFGELMRPHNLVTGSAGQHQELGRLLADGGLRERDVLEQRTCCWACEGWVRVELEWPLEPGGQAPCAVWAFTSLDGFRKGLRLRRTGQEPRFWAAKMVPPGYRLLVVYQVDATLALPPGARAEALPEPAEVELQASEDLPVLEPPPGQRVVRHQKSWGPSGDIEHRIVLAAGQACAVATGASVQFPLQLGAAGQRVVLLDGPDGPVTMPRVTEAEFCMRSQPPPPPRSPPFHSGFAAESEPLWRECLQADWSHAKVGRLVPEAEKREVLEVLEGHYRHILALYRYLSALDISGQAHFGVSQIQACNLMISAGLVDDVVTKISDIDRLFISSNVVPLDLPKDFMAGNDKSLIRFQFVEFLLRVARQHFMEGKPEMTMAKAVECTLCALEPAGRGRVSEMEAYFEALHTDEVDDLLKQHAGVVRTIFEHFSSRGAQRGRPAYLGLGGFQELLAAASLYSEEFQQRKGAVAYRMGMAVQADEVHSVRFREMSFLEFQQALGAVAFLRGAGRAPRLAPELGQLVTANLHRLCKRLRRAKSSGKPA